MPKHPRKLLMIASICSIIPLSGANAPAFAEPVWDNSDCPYARARAAAALAATERREAQSTVRWSEASSAAVAVFDVARAAPGLVP
ncbi:MAG TPA: hypothetical protein VF757_11150 [Sphingomicrobium sp.]